MRNRGDVPPKTVGVTLREEGVAVEYLDGRTTLYRGVPRPVADSVSIPPETSVHLLVTDPNETEGVLLYVNDLQTEDAILEDTGVGRVVLRDGDSEEVFPGVTVTRRPDERTVVTADLDVTRGRVFVFAEDDWTDRRYEFVSPERLPDEADESAGVDESTDTSESTDADDSTGGEESTATEPTGSAGSAETTTGSAGSAETTTGSAGSANETDTTDRDGWIEEPAVAEEPTGEEEP